MLCKQQLRAIAIIEPKASDAVLLGATCHRVAKNPLKYAPVEALIFQELRVPCRPGYKVMFSAGGLPCIFRPLLLGPQDGNSTEALSLVYAGGTGRGDGGCWRGKLSSEAPLAGHRRRPKVHTHVMQERRALEKAGPPAMIRIWSVQV